MYTYLCINILTILIPFALSFERRVLYVSKWKYLFPAIFIVGLIFIVWDYFFTLWGVWGFNHAYLVGVYILNLPLEEVLFFVCIPFSCVFIYEVLAYFIPQDIGTRVALPLTYVLVVILGMAGIIYLDKIYTSVTFLSLAFLLLVLFLSVKPHWLGRFYLMYLISLVPFLIVNGVLTNGLSFIEPRPVVWYNNHVNLSLRFIGIPLEDFFYSLLLLLGVVSVYEFLKTKY